QYGAIETKGGSLLQFVDNTGKRVALADFAATLPGERDQLERSKGTWFMAETALPTFSVAEVQAGFAANPNILVRTETLYKDAAQTGGKAAKDPTIKYELTKHKQRTLLTREESAKMLANAQEVVEGANRVRNEYGNKLFADVFFFITG